MTNPTEIPHRMYLDDIPRFEDILVSLRSDAPLSDHAADLRSFVNTEVLTESLGWNVSSEMYACPNHVLLYAAAYIQVLEDKLGIKNREHHSDGTSPSHSLKDEALQQTKL